MTSMVSPAEATDAVFPDALPPYLVQAVSAKIRMAANRMQSILLIVRISVEAAPQYSEFCLPLPDFPQQIEIGIRSKHKLCQLVKFCQLSLG